MHPCRIVYIISPRNESLEVGSMPMVALQGCVGYLDYKLEY